jgi:hypothetical protein
MRQIYVNVTGTQPVKGTGKTMFSCWHVSRRNGHVVYSVKLNHT